MAVMNVQPSEIDRLTADEFIEIHDDMLDYLQRTQGGAD